MPGRRAMEHLQQNAGVFVEDKNSRDPFNSLAPFWRDFLEKKFTYHQWVCSQYYFTEVNWITSCGLGPVISFSFHISWKSSCLTVNTFQKLLYFQAQSTLIPSLTCLHYTGKTFPPPPFFPFFWPQSLELLTISMRTHAVMTGIWNTSNYTSHIFSIVFELPKSIPCLFLL